MTEKENYERQLEYFYENLKNKKYYTSTEVMTKLGICLRTFRYRIAKLRIKYANVPSLLYKKDNKWYIHRQLLQEFVPIKRRTKTLFNKDWNTLVTWITRENYDGEYHVQLATEIKEAFPNGNFDYVIEQTKGGINHTHLVSDLSVQELKKPVDEIINNYIPKTDYRLQVEKVKSRALTRNYMDK
ncbi:hypothetical protein LZ575_19980 [Antarcticibacterium sp. 1MA-6-2]|uniref:hypothetical protein n=1 Tax=Antarcticibacterium sp. 1MA-6-2 TaxID=2908210 RepID=UPI001F3173AE|nr:hypothetical protein [Antarcticibacterium sp. 1MA-6-2]UJH90942.1 hypothetical protein LZ575_19980 [Antarcticibacterium sp. 1MA-6-2]